jgi:hypothetical protein
MPEQHTDFSNPVLRFWEPSFWKIPPVIKARQNENNNKFIRVKTFKTLPLYPREIIIEDSQHPDNDSDTEQDKK